MEREELIYSLPFFPLNPKSSVGPAPLINYKKMRHFLVFHSSVWVTCQSVARAPLEHAPKIMERDASKLAGSERDHPRVCSKGISLDTPARSGGRGGAPHNVASFINPKSIQIQFTT
jgi:hypothetical protein